MLDYNGFTCPMCGGKGKKSCMCKGTGKVNLDQIKAYSEPGGRSITHLKFDGEGNLIERKRYSLKESRKR